VSAERLLSTLSKVRQRGPGRWVACCPAHKDRRASLSVRELTDGRVLAHCFAGCGVDDVVHAAGLQLEDLFPPRDRAGACTAPAEPRPFSARDLVDALAAELRVAWLILNDVALGRELGRGDRKRAAVARERCLALIEELRLAR
jgi:hypothetical protein